MLNALFHEHHHVATDLPSSPTAGPAAFPTSAAEVH